jgi:hypothetical protein
VNQIVIAKRAQQQIDRIEVWWRAHRDKAPELFQNELAQAKEFLRATPNLARVCVVRDSRVIRWLLLPKTKAKLYFWVDEKTAIVHIVSAWGGQRGREPKL